MINLLNVIVGCIGVYMLEFRKMPKGVRMGLFVGCNVIVKLVGFFGEAFGIGFLFSKLR
ncbi:hypothetical protein HanXRQr2_Chr14g0644641 [Helianthus annuus]|uniref:Uncharacterized protein n=1 Tax=Helianthus annuus TaxID=4232 RepID=A0A9K3E917_HELAN|nr:hypothetical protein HanXRQr2_Chr14g0644641 [Helianthus annuus]KAJ0485792.1 hypothetical protein HanHA89_Chr14g0572361 [Helianthus annuus]KAJ0656344.1 hypothetical protein HanLR1_Chr14g0534751 [Helianthus annuus]KAJ0659980.1 hypothetical protein HanOQP8_Chr14g0532441 [Helianthus annuus]